jgi:hypothetical protein
MLSTAPFLMASKVLRLQTLRGAARNEGDVARVAVRIRRSGRRARGKILLEVDGSICRPTSFFEAKFAALQSCRLQVCSSAEPLGDFIEGFMPQACTWYNVPYW